MKRIKLFFLFLLVSAWVTPAPAANNDHSIAVIIGNKDYDGRIPDVDYAHRDAEAMKRYIIDVLGYRDGNIIDLRDASLADLRATFGDDVDYKGKLYDYIRPNQSNVTVFYSGHGVPDIDSRQAYLLPVNGDPNKARLSGYALETLYKNLELLPAKSVTLFIDACFSGDSGAGMLTRGQSGLTVEALPTKAGKKLTVITAAQGDQPASWDEKNQHGLFTHYLLEGLYGKADKNGNQDGKITLAEVKGWLDSEMTYQARRQWSRKQTASVTGDEAAALISYKNANYPKRPQLASLAPQTKQQATINFDFGDLDKKQQQIEATKKLYADQLALMESAYNQAETAAKKYDDGELKAEVWKRLSGLYDQQFSDDNPYSRRDEELRNKAKDNIKLAMARRPTAGGVIKDCDDCPEMVLIPAGSFKMGNNDGDRDEKPVHRVNIDYEFYMGKTEVTQSQWRAVMGKNPSHFKGDNRPVEEVSWYDIQGFLRKLNKKLGLSGKYAYRLPSEAEWEYAARAGTTTKYSFGDSKNQLGNYAWYRGNSGRRTHEVGQKRPNPFGLYDMHGNVWEWVADCYNNSYDNAPHDGRANTTGSCKRHVLRGGSWGKYPYILRSANRVWYDPDVRSGNNGFRLTRTAPPP